MSLNVGEMTATDKADFLNLKPWEYRSMTLLDGSLDIKRHLRFKHENSTLKSDWLVNQT